MTMWAGRFAQFLFSIESLLSEVGLALFASNYVLCWQHLYANPSWKMEGGLTHSFGVISFTSSLFLNLFAELLGSESEMVKKSA